MAANTTASWNEVEMPWARIWSAQGAGSWPVCWNWAWASGGAVRRKSATWVEASLRLAVPKTVTRMERPSEPPTCCMTLRRLEAAPASCGGTPETATTVRGTNSRPMPRPNTTIGARRPST